MPASGSCRACVERARASPASRTVVKELTKQTRACSSLSAAVKYAPTSKPVVVDVEAQCVGARGERGRPRPPRARSRSPSRAARGRGPRPHRRRGTTRGTPGTARCRSPCGRGERARDPASRLPCQNGLQGDADRGRGPDRARAAGGRARLVRPHLRGGGVRGARARDAASSSATPRRTRAPGRCAACTTRRRPTRRRSSCAACAARIFDVAVDLRPDSPTYCAWFGVELSRRRTVSHAVHPRRARARLPDARGRHRGALPDVRALLGRARARRALGRSRVRDRVAGAAGRADDLRRATATTRTSAAEARARHRRDAASSAAMRSRRSPRAATRCTRSGRARARPAGRRPRPRGSSPSCGRRTSSTSPGTPSPARSGTRRRTPAGSRRASRLLERSPSPAAPRRRRRDLRRVRLERRRDPLASASRRSRRARRTARRRTHCRPAADRLDVSLGWGRIFFLYGPHEDERRLVASVARALLAGVPARTTHGRQVRDFLHVSRRRGRVRRAARLRRRRRVNIGSGEGVGLPTSCSGSPRIVGRPDLVELGALEAPAMTRRCSSPTSHVCATRSAGEPSRSLDEGLRDTVEWWATSSAEHDAAPRRRGVRRASGARATSAT